MDLNIKSKMIFVVGNSRSGTTMIGRILNNNKDVFTFGELHFFDQLYYLQKKGENKQIGKKGQDLLLKLFCRQREGFFSNCNNKRSYALEIEKLNVSYNSVDLYKNFLFYETKKNKKIIPCEQTPRNLFFIDKILEFGNNVKVINMIRDPRDILISQKFKWRRRYLGASLIPIKEVIRAWVNYHPIMISLLWKASIKQYDQFKNHSKIKLIRFEKFLENPKEQLRKLTDFLGIEYNENMLQIPQVGSSSNADSRKWGINKNRKNAWERNNRINNTEIFFCEKKCGELMESYGYRCSNRKPNFFVLIYYYFTFLLKLPLVVLLNIKNIKQLTNKTKKFL